MPTESAPVCPLPSGTSAPLRVPPSGSYGWTLPKVQAPFKNILLGAFHLQQQLSGTPLGDLRTIGARTGAVRTVPLRVFDDGPDAWLVVASQGGTARHPAWLHNLAARPDQLWLRVNGVDHSVRPHLLEGDERDAAWRRVVSQEPSFAGYQSLTDRVIPVVRLTVTAAAGTSPPAAGTGFVDWRRWNLVGLTALTAYSTALGWQAQVVSYPLYRAVGRREFLDYHDQYNRSIMWVVVVPGFASFVAAMAFPWTRPKEVPASVAALVSASGITSILSTIAWAIPRHNRLDAIGQDDATIRSLLASNRIRTAGLTVGTAALCWCLGRMRVASKRGDSPQATPHPASTGDAG